VPAFEAHLVARDGVGVFGVEELVFGDFEFVVFGDFFECFVKVCCFVFELVAFFLDEVEFFLGCFAFYFDFFIPELDAIGSFSGESECNKAFAVFGHGPLFKAVILCYLFNSF